MKAPSNLKLDRGKDRRTLVSEREVTHTFTPSHVRKLSVLSHFLFLSLILALFIASYHSTLAWMLQRWGGVDSYYSHGYLVPFISGYLIWLKRDELRQIPLSSSTLGLVLIIFAVFLHLMGTVLYVFSLSGFSIFFLILGSVLFLFGKEFTKVILFPLIFLIFMFPLPLAFLSLITFPLKILVAKAGVAVVNLLGVPVLRSGFDITIPGGNLVVGNPCSGLRSLIAFLALGAILAYFTKTSNLKRFILFLLAIPIAIVSNAVRVSILILISHFYGLAAASPDSVLHVGSGLLVFVVGFFLLLLSGRLLQWKS